MTKYIVNKEFADSYGSYVDTGETWETEVWDRFVEGLVAHGFIEEVKEDTRWRAKDYGSFYYVSPSGLEVRRVKDAIDSWKDVQYELGNYFKSKETAELVAEALKLFFAYLHEPESNNIKRNLTLTKKFLEAVRKAEQAVLQDDKAGSDE